MSRADYIEREAVNDLIKAECSPKVAAYLIDAVATVPSADVHPVVKGKWIEYTRVVVPEPYNKWEQAWKCDKCGFDDGFPAYNFCPNCGADCKTRTKEETQR